MEEADEERKNPYVVAVEDYTGIDLSPEGIAGSALMSGADAEARSEEISLSDLTGPNPANMTPAMLDWYQLYVAPLRNLALSGLNRYFAELSAADKASGFVFAMREGTLEDQLLRDKLRIYKDLGERQYGDSERLRLLQTRLLDTRHAYETRKAEIGSDAKLLNRPLYLGVLTFVIFGSEALLNFESFEALPWASPAIAWGATILIGLAIGFAAHLHGTVYRQWAYNFGPAEDDSKRGAALRILGIGSAALMFALGFVYYARSAYLIAYTSSLSNFGQDGGGTGELWIVAGSLLGNIIVYLTGVLWAYMLHDSDPDYVELRISLIKLESQVRELEARLENSRTRALEQLAARHRRSLDAARHAYASVCTQPRFRHAQDLFARVQKQDDAVLALLLAYRNKLLQGLTQAKKTRFIAWNDGPHLRNEHITPSEYQRRPIRLKYLEA